MGGGLREKTSYHKFHWIWRFLIIDPKCNWQMGASASGVEELIEIKKNWEAAPERCV